MSFNSYSIVLAKTGPAGIPAMVGDVPGRGEVATYALDDDRVRLEEVGAAEAINVWPDAIGPGRWVLLGSTADWTRVVIGAPIE